MKKHYSSKYSDTSSIFNKSIEEIEEDSLIDMISSLKRKPTDIEMEEELPSLQFKKKRVLSSN